MRGRSALSDGRVGRRSEKSGLALSGPSADQFATCVSAISRTWAPTGAPTVSSASDRRRPASPVKVVGAAGRSCGLCAQVWHNVLGESEGKQTQIGQFASLGRAWRGRHLHGRPSGGHSRGRLAVGGRLRPVDLSNLSLSGARARAPPATTELNLNTRWLQPASKPIAG